MRNLLLAGALVSSAVLGAIAGGGIVQHRQASAPVFDYEACRSIVAKGSLSNPGVPDDWKSIETTPGGNWCVR
jgi:hypothetical protein